MLKTQQRFKSEITDVINNMALSSNDDKGMQPIDLVETYVYGTSEDLVIEKEQTKYNKVIKQYKND